MYPELLFQKLLSSSNLCFKCVAYSGTLGNSVLESEAIKLLLRSFYIIMHIDCMHRTSGSKVYWYRQQNTFFLWIKKVLSYLYFSTQEDKQCTCTTVIIMSQCHDQTTLFRMQNFEKILTIVTCSKGNLQTIASYSNCKWLRVVVLVFYYCYSIIIVVCAMVQLYSKRTRGETFCVGLCERRTVSFLVDYVDYDH